MSEQSIQLRSQASISDRNTTLNSSAQAAVAHCLSQAQRQLKHKPRFVEFACSYSEVHRKPVIHGPSDFIFYFYRFIAL